MKEALVLQAISGDSASLEQLLKEIYPQLYKTAFLYVKNEADALDIVQESVIKIIRKIHSLKESQYFSTWAIRIVIWTALDFLRSTKTMGELTQVEKNSIGSPLSADDHLDIYAALRLLPQHLQEITILHYFYGKKLGDISAVFNEPLGTVKYKLHQARILLKEYLREDDSDESQ